MMPLVEREYGVHVDDRCGVVRDVREGADVVLHAWCVVKHELASIGVREMEP